LLVCAAAGAHAQVTPTPPIAQAPAPSAPATPGELTQTTTVHGTPVDLSGQWLVLFEMTTNGVRRTMPFLLDIGPKDGRPEVAERFVDLPPEITTVLEQHNKAQTTWEPTAAELGSLAVAWPELAKADRGVLKVTTDVWEPSALAEAQRGGPEMQGAMWVMREAYEFAPGGQRPSSEVNVFVGTARAGSGWTGNALVAQVIAAPFPLPITLRGTFRMYKLDAATAPPRGLLERILDAFSGCRR
jgi:hypothetical protein